MYPKTLSLKRLKFDLYVKRVYSQGSFTSFFYYPEKTEATLKCSVLIVEDELIVAEDLKATLESWGFDVIGIVQSAKIALNLIKESRPDVVIMDVKIDGDLNGVETAVLIRNFFEQEIPIIFISGHSRDNYPLLKALTRHAYMNKPFDSEGLIEVIKTLGVNAPDGTECVPEILENL
jgi:DNA-binding response OmpR family regulator